MRIAIRVLGVVLALGVVWYLAQLIASESGEVVVLTTRDAAGEEFQTRLWIVDHEGHQWLRAGSDAAGWYSRLEHNPGIDVERNSVREPYTAVPVPSKAGDINRLMLEKYGWADRYIGFYFGRDDSVPVRLEKR